MKGILILAIATMLAGCDSTSIEDPFNVAISSVITSHISYSSSRQRYECSYDLALISSGGRSKDFGTFLDGQFTQFFSNGTSEYYPMTSDEVLDFWGKGRIGFDETLSTSRTAWDATRKFTVLQQFRIRISSSNEVITKSATLSC